MSRQALFEHIKRIVACIPAGKVATYGQIAQLAGAGARTVGWAMHSINDDQIPWHRVLNAQGRSSLREGAGAEMQRALLAEEGVVFDARGRADLRRCGWAGLSPWEVQELLRDIPSEE